MTSTKPHRRGAVVDETVLDATLTLLAEQGFGFNVEDVARRAGVHKTTIYRRWDTKPLLAAAAIERFATQTVEIRRTGDTLADLRRLAVQVARVLGSVTGRNLIRATLTAVGSRPELIDVARDFFIGRYAQATLLIADGQSDGIIRPGLDPVLIWQAIVNPLHMNAICELGTSEELARELTDLVLDGVLDRAPAARRPTEPGRT